MDRGGRLLFTEWEVNAGAGGLEDDLVLRTTLEEDVVFARAAAGLIEQAAAEYDLALRSADFLHDRIRAGHAVVALKGGELVGFGFWSEWEGGKFVSHSGLVVRRDLRRRGLGRRLKLMLFESSRRERPRATLISLTNSPQVHALNSSLGFGFVPLEELTADPAFWAGCRSCRNYTEVCVQGKRCCCQGMLLEPPE